MIAIVRRSLAATALVVAALLLAHSTGWAAFSLHLPFVHRTWHDWTQFRIGPDNNAVVPGKLETSWRIETGGQISSSPTFADGELYLGNNVGKFYAIDASTGKTLWMVRLGNPLMSAPILFGDEVIVGEGDATSMGATPSEPIRVGQGESSIIALDRHTGQIRWKQTMSGSAMPTPAIVNGVLIDHNGAGWVSGWDPLTGKKRFARRLDSVASMTAILPLGPDQFVTTGVGTNAVWRMSAVDGSVQWRSVFLHGASGIGDCPPVTDGHTIFCDYVAPVPPDVTTSVGRPATERAFGIDVNTGAKLWDVPLETGELPPRNEAAIPLLAGNVLVLGSAVAPAMHGLDLGTGRVVWNLKTHGPVKGGAVLVDGVVYFGDWGGYLWAVDARSGGVIGDRNEHTNFNVGSPVVDGRTLIIGSDSGTLIAEPLDDIRNHHD